MSWSRKYDGDEPQRINKWLSQSGVCSRREADALIEAGRIKINNEVVSSPGRKIEPGETLMLDEAATQKLSNAITAVLNKPVGYISAQPEKGQIPAVRLVTKSNLIGASAAIPTRQTRLAPVGRLDMDSRGLLLLTEDGVLTKAVIGPESDIEKEYIVTVEGVITDLAVGKLRHGLTLDNRQLKPAKVTREGGQVLRFKLREGRKRQIRRMCKLVGLTVVDLYRIRIGGVEIGDLPEGKWRALTDEERNNLIDPPKPAPQTSRKPPRRGKPKSGPDRNTRPKRTNPKRRQR